MEQSNNENELNIDLSLLFNNISRDDLLKLMGLATKFLGICTNYLAETEKTAEQNVQVEVPAQIEQVSSVEQEPAKVEPVKPEKAQSKERKKTRKWKNLTEHRAYVREALAPYFTEEFRSKGQESGLSKYEMLVNHLIHPRPSLMDEAKIAMVLFNNKEKIMTDQVPNAFSGWYRTLCNALDWKYVDDYRPHKLKSVRKFEKELSFLF